MGPDFSCAAGITPEELVAALGQASAALREALPAKPESCSSASASVRASHVYRPSALTFAFREVARLRKLLDRLPDQTPQALADSLAEYRQLLGQLRSQLPDCYGWLLAERERLGRRQWHSSGVEAWIRTNNQIR